MVDIKPNFTLNGVDIDNAVVEWLDLSVLATFDNENTQANITIDTFTFVNDAAALINNWILQDRIFEGLPITITVDGTSIFEGYIDLTDNYKVISPVKVQAKIKKLEGLNSLSDKAESTSLGYLYDNGDITNSDFIDIPYVVERPFDPLAAAIAFISVFIVAKELIESILKIAELVKEQTTGVLPNATVPPAPAPSSLASAIVQAILLAAYSAALIIALINLIDNLLQTLISPIRKHKAIRLRTALTKASASFGWGFDSDIEFMDTVVYLPSKPKAEEALTEGVPNPSDFGYRVSEFIELMNKTFDAKVAVIDGVVHLRPFNDPFWVLDAQYQLPDVLLEDYRYNTEDLKETRQISFQTDTTDEWTVEEFTGTNFVVVETPAIVSKPELENAKGYDSVNINVALGSRKDKLNGVENTLKGVASVVDSIVNLFGGSSSLASKIKNRVGMLRVSQNIHSIPKFLYVDGNGKLPSGHRSLFSAKRMYDKYWNYESFIENNYKRQRKIYEGVRVPFTFEDFNTLINNSYFSTVDGARGKAIKIDWNINNDFAVMDFWVEEVYTRNLKQTKIEA